MTRWDGNVRPLGKSGPRSRTCQYILDDDVPKWPDEPDFCGAGVLRGPPPECLPISSYCREHRDLCHRDAPQPTGRPMIMSGGKAMLG